MVCEKLFLIKLVDLFRYKGTYVDQEVAIKVLKSGNANSDVVKDFFQEVKIMRW